MATAPTSLNLTCRFPSAVVDFPGFSAYELGDFAGRRVCRSRGGVAVCSAFISRRRAVRRRVRRGDTPPCHRPVKCWMYRTGDSLRTEPPAITRRRVTFVAAGDEKTALPERVSRRRRRGLSADRRPEPRPTHDMISRNRRFLGREQREPVHEQRRPRANRIAIRRLGVLALAGMPRWFSVRWFILWVWADLACVQGAQGPRFGGRLRLRDHRVAPAAGRSTPSPAAPESAGRRPRARR